jgi:hypothetical protein
MSLNKNLKCQQEDQAVIDPRRILPEAELRNKHIRRVIIRTRSMAYFRGEVFCVVWQMSERIMPVRKRVGVDAAKPR